MLSREQTGQHSLCLFLRLGLILGFDLHLGAAVCRTGPYQFNFEDFKADEIQFIFFNRLNF